MYTSGGWKLEKKWGGQKENQPTKLFLVFCTCTSILCADLMLLDICDLTFLVLS